MRPRQKTRALAPMQSTPEYTPAVNEYYISAGIKCAWVKYITLIILALYLVIMLVLYRSYITYDNLAYLLRDFSSDAAVLSSDFSDVSYDEQSNMDFALYKGELAVAGTGDITLYNSSANKTFSYKSDMESPVFIPSEKYLLAYDLGGTHYSLFTNLTRVLNSEADSPIENASIADDGSYLLVTRARDSKYVVSTYSSSFRNEINYYKSRFVSDAAISRDAKTVAIASVDISGAFFTFSLELYEKRSETPFAEYSGTNLYPVSIDFFEDSSFALVCDSKILFFEKNGSLRSEYSPAGSTISAFDASDSTLAVVLSNSAAGLDNSIIIFDNSGNIIYNIDASDRITALSHSSSHLYALCPERVLKYTLTYENGQNTFSAEETPCTLDTEYVIEAGNFAIVGTKTLSKAVFGKINENNNITEEIK